MSHRLLIVLIAAALAPACATSPTPRGAFKVNGAICRVVPPDGWYVQVSSSGGIQQFTHRATGASVMVQSQPDRYAGPEYAIDREVRDVTRRRGRKGHPVIIRDVVYVRPPGADHGLVRIQGEGADEVAKAIKLVCSK